MHGRIFEIREGKLDKEDWLKEDDLYDEDLNFCDYFYDSENREDDLKWLKECLPPSIFKVNGDEIEIVSDGKEHIEEWLKEVQKRAAALSYENVTSCSETDKVRNLLKNVFNVDFMFYTDYSSYCHDSFNFLMDCINNYQGKKLYVCGILNYHY